MHINKQQRKNYGYSLIEVAIVLAVLGLLIGSSLIPLSRQYENQQLIVANAELEELQNAIIGYALSHRTTPVVIAAANTNASQVQRTIVPAGRPFLPCPDVSGDGIEDRHNGPMVVSNITIVSQSRQLISAREIVSPLVILSTIEISNAQNTNYLTHPDSGNPMHEYGYCVSDKGNFPWATLGTRAHDQYGNRFTYRVDPAFSSSVIGFGPESRVDVFDPRRPLVMQSVGGEDTAVYQRRRTNGYLPSRLGLVTNTTIDFRNFDENPTLICLGAIELNDGCLRTSATSITVLNTVLGNTTTTQRTIYDTDADGYSAARVYATNDIMDGPAFVIVSHGENAIGAIPHQQGRNVYDATDKFNCNTATNPSGYSMILADVENSDSFNLCITGAIPSTLSQAALPRNHSFVDMPIHQVSDQSHFDDHVVYMFDKELINLVTKIGRIAIPIYIPPVAN